MLRMRPKKIINMFVFSAYQNFQRQSRKKIPRFFRNYFALKMFFRRQNNENLKRTNFRRRLNNGYAINVHSLYGVRQRKKK